MWLKDYYYYSIQIGYYFGQLNLMKKQLSKNNFQEEESGINLLSYFDLDAEIEFEKLYCQFINFIGTFIEFFPFQKYCIYTWKN